MSATDWLSRSVSRFTAADKSASKTAEAAAGKAASAVKKEASSARGTHQRLQATLGLQGEALSPRMLRRILAELHNIIDERVSEVEGGRRAMAIAAWYAGATPERRRDLCLLMSEQFVADAARAKVAQAQFAAAVGTANEAVA